jgi:putative ABC transport system permease protein
MPRTPLAWRNLLHEGPRTLVAVAGVAFAVILIFVQLGFFIAIWRTATLIYDRLDFDLALLSVEYVDLNRPGTIPRERLAAVRGLSEVRAVRPLAVGIHGWRNPEDPLRRRRNLLILAVDPNDSPFRHPELTPERVSLLNRPGAVFLDRLSHRNFGRHIVVGETETDLGLERVTVEGRFTLGSGFAADGLVITSLRTLAHVFGPPAGETVSLGLIKLAEDADAATARRVAAQLRSLLPVDVRVVTRQELEDQERTTWVWKRSLGKIFVLGLVIAFLVGVVFVYQVIASDIGNKLGEYATLKAMGYSDSYLGGVVLQQAVLLALFSFGPGIVVAEALYWLMRRYANLPVTLTMTMAALVLGLTVTMCCLSGLFALRKVRSADPADLF